MKGSERMDDIATKILRYRAEHDISQAEMARRCKVTLQTINSIENGLQNPSALTRTKIMMVIEKGESENAEV